MRFKMISCEDCVAWKMTPQNMNQGMCCLKPPQVFPIPTPQGLQFIAVRPTTDRKEGCSEGSAERILQ